MPKTNTKIKDLKEKIINKDVPEKSKEPETILFDRAATQTVNLSFNYKGKTVEVSHTLNFPSDERIVQFYREATVEQKVFLNGTETDSEISNASIKLWNELAVSRAGYANNDRPDWKEKTNPIHKESAVTGLLSGSGMFPETLYAEFIGVDDGEQTTVQIKSLFDGQWHLTVIVFNQPNAEQMRRYKKIRNTSVRREGEALVETTNINLTDRAELFDELVFEAIGYQGSVPVNHKAEAAMTLFENEIEVIAKN